MFLYKENTTAVIVDGVLTVKQCALDGMTKMPVTATYSEEKEGKALALIADNVMIMVKFEEIEKLIKEYKNDITIQ